MKGSIICTIEIYTPIRLKTNVSGCSIIPVHIKKPLIKPPFCSKTIQAAVRTSSEVQNGSKTNIISKLLDRVGKVANKYANGYANNKVQSVTTRAITKVLR